MAVRHSPSWTPRGVPADRVVLFGESLGTGVAVHLAGERPVAGVVLQVPYTSIADVTKIHYWFLPVDLMLKDRFESLAAIGHVHAPLLVGVAGQDEVVTAEQGRRLFAAAHQPKQLFEAPDARHNDLFAAGFDRVVVDFIRHLPGPQAGPAGVPHSPS